MAKWSTLYVLMHWCVHNPLFLCFLLVTFYSYSHDYIISWPTSLCLFHHLFLDQSKMVTALKEKKQVFFPHTVTQNFSSDRFLWKYSMKKINSERIFKQKISFNWMRVDICCLSWWLWFKKEKVIFYSKIIQTLFEVLR